MTSPAPAPQTQTDPAPVNTQPPTVTAPAAAQAPAAGSAAPAGGQAATAPAHTAPDPSNRTYTVRPGDSLWSIASRLLGPGASDRAIAAAVQRLWRLNAARIGTGDPSLLPVGVELRLR